MLVLLHKCTNWTNKTLRKNARWKLHNNATCYFEKNPGSSITQNSRCTDTDLSSQTIQVKGTKHIGHCWKSTDELISNILLWTPTHGHISVGQPAKTYPSAFCRH